MKIHLAIIVSVLLTAICPIAAASNRDATQFTNRDGLSNTLNKLKSGVPTKVAYLGGSITLQEGWRVMTQNWLQANYPTADHIEILAAIGGTNSELGAFRVGVDVLQYNPDLVFIEFAVNDAATHAQRLRETMEGIVRQIWQHDPNTDICFVYTITEKQLSETADGSTFANSASEMEAVADHYGIPTINMAHEVPKLAKAGALLFRTQEPKSDTQREALGGKIPFSGDGVHPYPSTGHPIYFKQIENALPTLLKTGTVGPHEIPAALEANNFENAIMLPVTAATLTGNWTVLSESECAIPSRLKSRADQIWVGRGEGSQLSLKFKGDYVGIYGARGPDSGAFDFSLNGVPREQQAFDKYCTYHRLSSNTLAANLSNTVHELEITVSGRNINKAAILKENNNEAQILKNPELYARNNLYIASIMIRGEIVED